MHILVPSWGHCLLCYILVLTLALQLSRGSNQALTEIDHTQMAELLPTCPRVHEFSRFSNRYRASNTLVQDTYSKHGCPSVFSACCLFSVLLLCNLLVCCFSPVYTFLQLRARLACPWFALPLICVACLSLAYLTLLTCLMHLLVRWSLFVATCLYLHVICAACLSLACLCL